MPYMYVYKIEGYYHERGKSPFTKCGKNLSETTETRTLGGFKLDPKLEEMCSICFEKVIESIKKVKLKYPNG